MTESEARSILIECIKRAKEAELKNAEAQRVAVESATEAKFREGKMREAQAKRDAARDNYLLALSQTL